MLLVLLKLDSRYRKYSTLLIQLEKIDKTRTIISDLLQIFVDAKELKQTKQKYTMEPILPKIVNC